MIRMPIVNGKIFKEIYFYYYPRELIYLDNFSIYDLMISDIWKFCEF